MDTDIEKSPLKNPRLYDRVTLSIGGQEALEEILDKVVEERNLLKRELYSMTCKFIRLKSAVCVAECCIACTNYMVQCKRGILPCKKFEFNTAKYDREEEPQE